MFIVIQMRTKKCKWYWGNSGFAQPQLNEEVENSINRELLRIWVLKINFPRYGELVQQVRNLSCT